MTASPAAVGAAREAMRLHVPTLTLSNGARRCGGCSAWFSNFDAHRAEAVADAVVAVAAREALEAAADEIDLPGSDASGYYASEARGGYAEAERDAEAWLRARAEAIGGRGASDG